jgi:uncharacterized Zn-binding protein involved in type VI secretion
MMRNIIRIGDKTTGGGTVQSGSAVVIFRGIGVARQGDPVICPLFGPASTEDASVTSIDRAQVQVPWAYGFLWLIPLRTRSEGHDG